MLYYWTFAGIAIEDSKLRPTSTYLANVDLLRPHTSAGLVLKQGDSTTGRCCRTCRLLPRLYGVLRVPWQVALPMAFTEYRQRIRSFGRGDDMHEGALPLCA